MSKSSSKPIKSRPRGRSTAGIIKAAKAAGAESITFPDGTIVKLTTTSPSNEAVDDLRAAEATAT